MELFAAVDVRGGSAVRLLRGDFDHERVYGDPLALARSFVEAGAAWLHVVDLDGARSGRPANREVVTRIARESPSPVQAGGGLRDLDDVAALMSAGVARVVLGTAALEDAQLLARCAARYPGRVTLGLDYRRHGDGSLEVAARGWTSPSGRLVAEVLESLQGESLCAVVATAIDQDGTLEGPDLHGLATVLDATEIPVIASGGVGSTDDLVALGALRSPRFDRSPAGVVVGKALADGRLTVREALAACAPSG